jgi:hemolysin D
VLLKFPTPISVPAKVADSKESFEIVGAFQSETEALRGEAEPRLARATVMTMAALFVSLIVLACLTRLDRVVTSVTGKIVSSSQVNVIQALDPSIIRSIDVKVGEEVQKDQQLATLDPTLTAADVRQYREQVASLEAQIARDRAQLEGVPLALAEPSDPDLKKYADIQRAYYDQQIAQYKAQVASFDAKILQTQATVTKYSADQATYQHREEIAQKVEDMRAVLAAHGSGSQLNLYTSQDQRLELLRSLEFDHNSLVESEHTLASLRADREAFIQQWFTQLSQDLATARNNLDIAKAQLTKAEKHQDLVRITALEPSVILTLANVSIGSVLKEGDTLFTTMPLTTPVEGEIHILSRDVGFVRPGDRCVIKIDAFNYMEHGTAEGTIRWISANAFTVDDDNRPVDAFYKARCGIDQAHFTQVPANFRLIPGMTLSADINVGTRSVALYVLGGVLRGFSEAMREP